MESALGGDGEEGRDDEDLAGEKDGVRSVRSGRCCCSSKKKDVGTGHGDVCFPCFPFVKKRLRSFSKVLWAHRYLVPIARMRFFYMALFNIFGEFFWTSLCFSGAKKLSSLLCPPVVLLLRVPFPQFFLDIAADRKRRSTPFFRIRCCACAPPQPPTRVYLCVPYTRYT